MVGVGVGVLVKVGVGVTVTVGVGVTVLVGVGSGQVQSVSSGQLLLRQYLTVPLVKHFKGLWHELSSEQA